MLSFDTIDFKSRQDCFRSNTWNFSHNLIIYFKNISIKRLVEYIIMASALALLADIPSSFGNVYFASKVFLYICLFASLLFGLRISLIFLLMISTVCQDIVQTQTETIEQGGLLMASMWQGGLGFLRPSWFMMAYCLALLIKFRDLSMDRTVIFALLWFSFVPLFTGFLYGAFGTPVVAIEIPNDIKLPLFLLVSILLYFSYLKNRPEALAEFATAFLGSVLARHFIDFAYWLLGMGSIFSEITTRVSVDSTKGTVVFMLLFAMSLVIQQRRYIIGGIIGVISGTLLVAYSTRGLWVSAALGVWVVLLMLRTRRWLIALPIVGILAYSSFQVLAIIRPASVELARKVVGLRTERKTGNLLYDIDPNRYIEFLNAADATLKRGAVLWGSGYGSFYTESVAPFPITMQNAFSKHSLVNRQYHVLHNFVLAMVFKYGLIGFLIISSLWFFPAWRCFKAFRNMPPSFFSSVIVATISFFPTSMLELSWTGKGMIIGGFLIAFCMSAYRQTCCFEK